MLVSSLCSPGTLTENYDGPEPSYTDNLSEITQNPDIHSVIVATPPSVRIDLITELTNAGKHILLEKPIGRNLDEALQVVDICEKAECTLGMLFQHQLRATTLEARRLLSSGELGDPGLIEIAVPIWRDQSYYDELGRGTHARDGGGVLMTHVIHMINLTLSLAAPVAQVQAMTATTPLHTMEAEDYAVAGLRFTSGAVGSLIASTASYPHGTETITMHCQHGSLKLTAEKLETSWRDGRREIFPAELEDTSVVARSTPRHLWHQAIIKNFLESVSEGHDPMVAGRAALASHHLIDAIKKSSKTTAAIDLTIEGK
ncbi:MAG: Gfo/Idh/MocA family protein [Granulosicoccus sp.]